MLKCLSISGYWVLLVSYECDFSYIRVRVPYTTTTWGQWAEGPQYSIYILQLQYQQQYQKRISSQTKQRALFFGGISIIMTPEYNFTKYNSFFPIYLSCGVVLLSHCAYLHRYYSIGFVKWLRHYEIKIAIVRFGLSLTCSHIVCRKNSASW